MAGPNFALVLLLQVLAVYKHVVEKPDSWWVLRFVHKAAMSLEHLFTVWWFMACIKLVSSVTRYTSRDFSSECFDVQWFGDFSSTTSSEWRCWRFSFCVLGCVDAMWESEEMGNECSFQPKRMYCVCGCVCEYVSPFCRKVGHSSIAGRCKFSFLYLIKLSFMKCLCGKRKNKVEDPVQSQDQS